MAHQDPLIRKESTEEDLKRVAVHGGRIDALARCQIIGCDALLPHYHLFCTECGCEDGGNTNCIACGGTREVTRIVAWLEEEKMKRLKRKGYLNVYDLLRVILVLIIFTIATWKGGIS